MQSIKQQIYDIFTGVLFQATLLHWVHRKAVFYNRLTLNKVFLNDPLQYLWTARVIPCALWIDHGHRSSLANSQTVRFSSEHFRLWAGKAQFLKSFLQEIPRGQADFFTTALGLALICT